MIGYNKTLTFDAGHFVFLIEFEAFLARTRNLNTFLVADLCTTSFRLLVTWVDYEGDNRVI